MHQRFKTARPIGPIAVITAFTSSVCLAGPIEDLRPGHWYEVPDSTIASVTPKPPPPGVHGPTAVIGSASGGAYDSKRDLFLVWGGGHSQYSGNEIYAFDLKTLKWRRIIGPSRDVGGYEASGYYPDGQPRARHTYDFIEYIPSIDRFCSFGAAGLYPSGQGAIGNVDCLDLDTLKWERKANALSYGIGATTAFDPSTQTVWMHGSGNHGFLTRWDPKKNHWSIYGRRGIEKGFVVYYLTADFDPKRKLYVAAGLDDVYIWDTKQQGDIGATHPAIKGPVGGIGVKAPGFVYDPVVDKFVAWSGGAEVYLLDMDKMTWTKRPPADDNKVVPSLPAIRGTFGRFRYVPSKNVYIVVNDILSNVYIYKLAPNPKKEAK